MGSVIAARRLQNTGLVALRHKGSSLMGDQTHVSCLGGQILYHRATREVPVCFGLVLLVTSHSLQGLSPLVRDGTRARGRKARSANHCTARALPTCGVRDCIVSAPNSYIEILIPSVSERGLFANRVLTDVISEKEVRVEWGWAPNPI